MLRISIEPPDNKSWSKGLDNDLHLGENMKSIQTDINPTEIATKLMNLHYSPHNWFFYHFFFVI